MRPRPILPAAAILLCLSMPAWAAGTIKKVVVTGLDDDLMEENVLAALSVNASLGQRLGESRLEYLLAQAEPQAREALEPFGYYAASVQVDAPRGQADAEGRVNDEITVTVHVQPGEPVRVRDSDIRIEGEGAYDTYLQDDIADFSPKPGERFDHTTYETSKLAIVRRLAERGYLDADFDQRRVEVTRAEHAADIDLSWVSGIRYDMGPTTFQQDYFRPGLLEQLVYWEEGDYFHQGKLDRLRESLVGLDYFSRIDIQADPDNAEDGRVPINVGLGLAKRDIYTYGLSYGTESGPGVRAGLDRRYVNSRGHKWSTQLDYADKRKQFTSLYRIPAFKWLDGWYGVATRLYDEQTRYIDTRRVELIGSRNGQFNERLTGTLSVHVLRERWSYGSPGYEYSTLSYPEISAQYIDVDNRLFPRAGVIANASLRGGLKSIGSDANFGQAHIAAQWHFGIGEVDRLLLRGEAGTTVTGDLVAMPPSLRFFAGGDRSVRGYAWREVGPRLANGYALGARNMLTGSVEYEHYFGAGPWGMALFTDAGSAFDSGSPDFKAGVGIGARWRSPIGPVRIDVARGLDDPDSSVELYLSIGVGL